MGVTFCVCREQELMSQHLLKFFVPELTKKLRKSRSVSSQVKGHHYPREGQEDAAYHFRLWAEFGK